MRKVNKLIALTTIIFLGLSCQKNNTPIIVSPQQYHASIDKVTKVIIHDIFSPPVASRIYAYPNIGAYEILAKNNAEFQSLAGQLKGLTAIPALPKDKTVNTDLAALITHIDLSRRLIFSEDRITTFRDSLYNIWQGTNKAEFLAAKDYGLKVAEHIVAWMDKDNYKQTRTMPKFSVNTEDASRWQPTPPAYMDGIEPHWNKIRPFVIDSASQFKPVPPPTFSMEIDSDFYKEVKEVYDISQKISAQGDQSEEIQIAQFWDCNPYVSVTRGHLMFATKKITPGGHWMGIAKIAANKNNASLMQTVHTYTKTSISLADGFISCWDEKYRSNLIRPETLINEHIDDSWQPVLQTPPFPEYTSGHSVISGAAATALTSIYGDNFAFDDDTEVAYGLPIRSFTSFNQAAEEAAISRMYGGIHYRAAVEVGIKQGKDLGNFIVNKLKFKTDNSLATTN